MADAGFDVSQLPAWAKQVNVRLEDQLRHHQMDGPVCHVGSLLNKPGSTDADALHFQNKFRSLANREFVGVDLFDGPNVHVVGDLCATDFLDKRPNLTDHFGVVLCSALMEHVQRPYECAANILGMIKPGGHLFFQGPWVWGFHPYPGDYWRISFQALKILFPGLEWKQWYYMGTNRYTGIEIDDPKRERALFNQPGAVGAASLITDRSMPYLNIGAIGQKPKA